MKFRRFTALLTLIAFLGLSAAESHHKHQAYQTDASCPVCQIAHRTPAILSSGSIIGPIWISLRTLAAIPLQSYVQFVFVAHGLSPPLA